VHLATAHSLSFGFVLGAWAGLRLLGKISSLGFTICIAQIIKYTPSQFLLLLVLPNLFC